MRRSLIPLLMAVVIASVFCPWVVKYDIPYPGVEYKTYVQGYEIPCGWIVLFVVFVLALFHFVNLTGNADANGFVRALCCLTGILVTVAFIISKVFFVNYTVERPFFGVVTAMLAFGGLLIVYYKNNINFME